MKIAHKLKFPSNFFKKLISEFEVITFIWYMKIIDSSFIQKTLCIGRIVRTNPKRIVEKIGYILPRLTKMDHAGTLSNAEKATQIFIQSQSPEKTQQELKGKGDTSMTKLPIVFIHYSNDAYLKYSLHQAKTSNPESTIYLLGDSSNDCYDFVEHHYFLDYFQGAGELSKIYRHYNTTGFHYDLFNFQRWFVLKEFLIANKLEKCLYLDSDVMLYADVTEEKKKFEQFDFTVSGRISGHTFFLNRVEALSDFCNFLIGIFTKRDRYHYDKMVAHFAVRKKNHLKGGVCDMTVLEFYGLENFGKVGEVSLIIDGSVFDTAITHPGPGVEMNNGIKKIIWKDGIPYGSHLRTGKEIKFNSLHCQGTEGKRLMPQYYNR